MKTSMLLLTAFATLAGEAVLAGPDAKDRPTGTLDVSKRFDRTGFKPMVNWNIQYPEDINEMIDLDDRNTVTLKQDLLVEIRVVGTSYQPYGEDADVQFNAKIGGCDWQQLFLGKTADLNPAEPVYSQVVRAGSTIDVSSKGHHDANRWTPSRQTGVGTLNVKALVNGDDVPRYSPAFQQGDIESHVSSYVNDGKMVLNPRDVIYLVELGQNNPLTGGFDMQDLVVVISFKDVPSPPPAGPAGFGFGFGL